MSQDKSAVKPQGSAKPLTSKPHRLAARGFLSKSKILSFVQCPRRLYLEVHHPALASSSDGANARMNTGTTVGEIARSLHKSGVLVEGHKTLSEAMRITQQHLVAKQRKPLFEATFAHNGTLVRTDLLLPRKKWDLVEVKSTTSVKECHLHDAAIQSHVLQSTGLRLGRVSIRYINSNFVYPGKDRYSEIKRSGACNNLFAEEDVSKAIAPLVKKHVPAWIASARATLAGELPARTENCDAPYECGFKAHCYPQTTAYPLTYLPQLRASQRSVLTEAGFTDIREIPDGTLDNERQERVREVTRSGKAELKKDAARQLSKLAYPRYYLDFETIQFAVPIWKRTRPYRQLPFQWSCHVEGKDDSLAHHCFLNLSGDDPTRQFAEQLISTLGKRGVIFVYNQQFEEGVVRQLAQRYRDLAKALNALIARFVDLLPITRNNYYHPAMCGSWSLKSVLPTIAPELDYADLEDVKDGSAAQQAYLEAIATDTKATRKEKLRQALLTYCERDTYALVRLAQFLRGQCQGTSD